LRSVRGVSLMSVRAAIDIGTNSVRLLIVKMGAGKLERILESDLITTRIGEGMATNSSLKKEAMERTILALKCFRDKLGSVKPDLVRAVATSAVRDADNGLVFCELVKEETGLKVEIISGQEEAYLSYFGVVNGFEHAIQSSLENTIVVDVGGGSTEIIWTNKEEQLCCESLPIGAVRLADGNYNDDLIEKHFQVAISNIPRTNLRVVGVGGTITTLAAIDLKLDNYDPKKVHGYELTLQRIKEIYRYLNSLSLTERVKVPGIQAQRADIIIPGIKIFEVLLKSLQMEKITVSEADILHGIILSLEKNIS